MLLVMGSIEEAAADDRLYVMAYFNDDTNRKIKNVFSRNNIVIDVEQLHITLIRSKVFHNTSLGEPRYGRRVIDLQNNIQVLPISGYVQLGPGWLGLMVESETLVKRQIKMIAQLKSEGLRNPIPEQSLHVTLVRSIVKQNKSKPISNELIDFPLFVDRIEIVDRGVPIK